VIDARLSSEWMALRIGTVVHILLNELSTKAHKLDRTQRLVAACFSAYRSSMAVDVLERLGFERVSSMVGGAKHGSKPGHRFPKQVRCPVKI